MRGTDGKSPPYILCGIVIFFGLEIVQCRELFEGAIGLEGVDGVLFEFEGVSIIIVNVGGIVEGAVKGGCGGYGMGE